jgi:hypothetical protein
LGEKRGTVAALLPFSFSSFFFFLRQRLLQKVMRFAKAAATPSSLKPLPSLSLKSPHLSPLLLATAAAGKAGKLMAYGCKKSDLFNELISDKNKRDLFLRDDNKEKIKNDGCGC